MAHEAITPTANQDQARFLSSHNPAQVKRNVLASFTDVLLLPVTIVPRTTAAVGKAFGAAWTTGGNAAVQGISMLNPQRWGATNGNNPNGKGYQDFGKAETTLFDIGLDEDEEEEEQQKKKTHANKNTRCK